MAGADTERTIQRIPQQFEEGDCSLPRITMDDYTQMYLANRTLGVEIVKDPDDRSPVEDALENKGVANG